MGTFYKISCKHCGAQFDHYGDNSYGVLPRCVGCGEDHIETQMAIRCPGCMRRLNNTEQEFKEQVQEVIVWE
ncbi:MAG: hypothetical protein SNH35_05185 [Rikenellaceae bacterium]